MIIQAIATATKIRWSCERCSLAFMTRQCQNFARGKDSGAVQANLEQMVGKPEAIGGVDADRLAQLFKLKPRFIVHPKLPQFGTANETRVLRQRARTGQI